MSTTAAIQAAISGIQSGMTQLNRSSAEIASQTTSQSPADLARPLIEMSQQKLQVEASVKALNASNQMLGKLLDIQV